jgi:hypothetical protein
MMNLQHTTNQHTTPRCYLKNFSDNGTTIYRKYKRVDSEETRNEELQQPISLKKATVEDNFYTLSSATEPMAIETLFYAREIENYYPKYYEMLIDPNIIGLPTMEDRSRMLMCMLSLHCRTPKQFRLFLEIVPDEHKYELDAIKQDYKALHIGEALTNFIAAHQFKVIRIARIIDTSEFFTSDNPVLIVDGQGNLQNHEFRQQFNIDNKILIPLDPKHCLILTGAFDKNGISIQGKGFYNKIERIDVDCGFTQSINWWMLGSADKCYYGSQKYMNAFFSLYNLVE